MSGIGHNNGPSMASGGGFRRVAWKRARTALLPAMPLEVVRMRVRRAEALGLPYKTYASIRAASGDDIIGFLFSTNALRLIRQTDQMPTDRSAKLASIDAERHALLMRPVPDAAFAPVPFDSQLTARPFTAPWTEIRGAMEDWLRCQCLSGGRIAMIGETRHERDHCEAGRLAAFLSAEQYFDGAAT